MTHPSIKYPHRWSADTVGFLGWYQVCHLCGMYRVMMRRKTICVSPSGVELSSGEFMRPGGMNTPGCAVNAARKGVDLQEPRFRVAP